MRNWNWSVFTFFEGTPLFSSKISFSFLVQKNHLSLGLKSFLLDESELQPSKGKKDTKKKEIKRFLT